MRRICLYLVFFWSFCFAFVSQLQARERTSFDFSDLKKIPIFAEGRVKPLDTFARESVFFVTGKTFYEGREPIETLFLWLINPEQAFKEPWIKNPFYNWNDPKKSPLPTDQKHLSLSSLQKNEALELLLNQANLKRQRKEKLLPLEEKAEALLRSAEIFHGVVDRSSLEIVPDLKMQNFRSLAMLPSEGSEAFGEISKQFEDLLTQFKENRPDAFFESSKRLKNEIMQISSAIPFLPSERILNLEVFFNKLHPFRLAAILFLVGSLLICFSFFGSRLVYRLGFASVVVGFLVCVVGFVLRSLIADRAPVSNLYEMVLWAGFGAVLFALIFEAIFRSRYFLLAGSIGAALVMLLADQLPTVLNPAIKPLEPVLRSNYWLTIHVLTIVLGYSGFLLSMVLGQILLGLYAAHSTNKTKLRELTLYMYRAIQVGVLLLAAGTLLGGFWAEKSWGRFWGWDPKEVWALIALLGYLAILHGRFTGWLRDFGFAAWGVLAFLLILMASYGVNFILAKGLHSYGFSEGGFFWVAIFVGTQIAWVAFSVSRYRLKK